MAPRICIGSTKPSERVSGLSKASTASLNSVPGDRRISSSPISCTPTYWSRFLISDGARAMAIAGPSCGQMMKKNSQSPRAQSADVAVERKITENSIATASQTPP